MEYGRLEPDELHKVDFALPDDPQETINVLIGAGPSAATEINIGCGRWGHKTWLGNIYPKHIKEKDFLKEYVSHFNSIEVKSTFYQVSTPEQVAAWKNLTEGNPNFKFYPLMPQSISHIRRLKNAEQITVAHLNSLQAFGTKLGPSLLQLGENFSPKAIPELKSYLSLLPENFDLFIELRHQGWFMPETINEVIELFKSHGKGFAITDTPGRRDVLHMNLTTPHAFIRFSASGDIAIDKQRLDFWNEKINHWKKLGLKSIGFFVSHPHPRYEPELCEYLKQKISQS